MIVSTGAWILGSICSSISLIMLNKHIMSNYHFNWPVTLSTYHFFCTGFLLEIMCRLGLFKRASVVTMKERFIVAFVNVGSIIFMNLNLKMNSVGFYQLSKLACVPVTLIINFILYGKVTPLRTIGALLLLVVGIALFSVNDFSMNFAGTIIAIIAVLFCVVTQMQISGVSKKYGIFGPPVQHIVAPPMVLCSAIMCLFTEVSGPRSIFHHTFELPELLLVLLTGVLALCSNVCAFALMGKTSAVTYQVVSHTKTILIFTLGLLFFDKKVEEPIDQTIKKISGIILGVVGTILYTTFEMQDKEKEKLKAEAEKNEQEDELAENVTFATTEEEDDELELNDDLAPVVQEGDEHAFKSVP